MEYVFTVDLYWAFLKDDIQLTEEIRETLEMFVISFFPILKYFNSLIRAASNILASYKTIAVIVKV